MIPVVIKGNFISGKVPTLITLTINYYQVTQTQKRILEASLLFDQFVAPTQAQISKIDPFYYNLNIFFKPMTHFEITILFGFPSTVYLILYVGIFIIALIIIGIFLLYNRIITRYLQIFLLLISC